MKPLKVGVIGSGYWGPNLIRNFVEMPTSRLVAVADLDPNRLAHIKERYPQTMVTQDYRDLFSMNLDAVVIATPPVTHYAIARDCLMHGLHVLVEKPLTLRSDHAEELVALAEARGLTLMVGHTFEYNSAVHELKRLIDSGELGRIYYVDAVRVNLGLFHPNLNVLWDLAVHDVSIMLYLFGHETTVVSAHGTSCIFDDVYDIAYLHMMFPTGTMAHIRTSWLDPSKTRRITVVGSKKMVIYDDVESLEKIKIYDKGVERLPYTDTYGDFNCSYRYGDVVVPNLSFVEPLRQECEHFLDSIIHGTQPRSNGAVGLNVVKVLELAERSLRSGGSQQTAILRHPFEQEHVLSRNEAVVV